MFSRCEDVEYRITIDGSARKTQTRTAKPGDGDEIYREDGYIHVDGVTNEDSYWDGDAYEITGPIVGLETHGDAEIAIDGGA
ncbi:MAG: hypothetical protein ACQETB_09900 [Halobacteriota archaeon]